MARSINAIELRPPQTRIGLAQEAGITGASQGILVPSLVRNAPITPAVPDVELETPSLPRDLPQWAKDAISISSKTRELLTHLKPVVVSILTFWDHRLRTVLVGGRSLRVDPSGSYRID